MRITGVRAHSAETANGTRPVPQALPHTRRTIALLPAGDRFEDFHDKIGVSLETFGQQLAGGWLFNYIKALRLAGVRTVLIYTSARVTEKMVFTHVDTGASVWVLPSPRLHQRARHAHRRFFPGFAPLAGAASYFATPMRSVARVFRQERCDAILCQEYENTRFDCCVLLGRLLGLPVFATYQGGNKTTTAIERPVRRQSIRRSAGLIIASRPEISRVQRAYGIPPTKIRPIPNPVEVVTCGPSERQAVRSELGISSETRIVAWHGRVQIPKKGLDILVDAWDRICSERPQADIRLLLVGTGRDAGAFRQRIQSSAKIVWVDQYVLDRRQLWSYLAAADIYTIPSRYEGFAVAPLEAMACGLPVVASDAEGVADVLPRGEADGGIIVPRDNAEALATALLRLVDDSDLARRLGAVGRRRIDDEFSLEIVGHQLQRFLFPSSVLRSLTDSVVFD
jgi:glycosyltransferase involved in cell wall biosynthesis